MVEKMDESKISDEFEQQKIFKETVTFGVSLDF